MCRRVRTNHERDEFMVFTPIAGKAMFHDNDKIENIGNNFVTSRHKGRWKSEVIPIY